MGIILKPCNAHISHDLEVIIHALYLHTAFNILIKISLIYVYISNYILRDFVLISLMWYYRN